MNRIITILVTIFILLLLYIWISHVWGSDKTRHPRQIVDAKETQLSDELISEGDTMQITGDVTDPVTEEEPAVTEEKKPAPVEEVKTPKVEEKKVEQKPVPKKTEPVVTKSKPVATPAKQVKPETTTATTSEEHLVIAGNFTQKANAEQRVKELKKAGFPDTEIVNFDLSEYFTVCVGRFSDVNEARKLVKKLKDYHKIDAYVRIGG
jgi:cell division protein FtsN